MSSDTAVKSEPFMKEAKIENRNWKLEIRDWRLGDTASGPMSNVQSLISDFS